MLKHRDVRLMPDITWCNNATKCREEARTDRRGAKSLKVQSKMPFSRREAKPFRPKTDC